MAGTIYATMRKYDQNLHKFARSERAKAEKQAEIIAQNKGDPNQTLRILGIRSSVHHDVEQYNAIEAKEGLIPWNDEDDNLIDRFDGRALLDFYREPPKNRAPQQKTDEEEELEEQLCFESFRDLVVLLQSCEDDEAGLQKVEKGEMEEGARQSYEKSTHAKVAKKASATGAFAAVGFSYGGEANPPPPEKDGSSDEDEDNASSSSESSESDVGNEKYEGVNKTAEDLFGLEDFSGLLKRERREKKNAKAVLKKPNPMGSRRQRRKKIRELRSQGITDRDAYKQFKPQQPPPSGNPPPEPSYRRRSSPTYDAFKRRERSPPSSRISRRDRDGSVSPPRRQYITDFGTGAASSDEETRRRRGRLPTARPADTDRERPILEALRRDPAGDPSRLEPHTSIGSSSPPPRGHAGADERRPGAAGKPTAASGAVNGAQPGKKETPMERLKRLTAARLNKQITKDSSKEVDKIRQLEKEREYKKDALRQARQAAFRARRSPSRSRSPPPRSRSPHARRRSRSRSPSRNYRR